MTPPEKEFELKPESHVCYVASFIGNESKAWYIGRSQDGGYAIEVNGSRLNVNRDNLTEWNPDPKPKSFEEEREALAKSIEPELYDPDENIHSVPASVLREWAAGVRALQPDAPAAAVAGSADTERLDWLATMYVRVRLPLMYGSKELFDGLPLSQFDDELAPPWDIRTAIDKTRDSLEPLPIEPPSPPRPNPVGRVDVPHIIAKQLAVPGNGPTSMNGHELWTGFQENSPEVYPSADACSAAITAKGLPLGWVRVPLKLTTPPAASAAFDEAAERKLFEALPDNAGLDKGRGAQGLYFLRVLQERWNIWLASAKVQRVAVPAVVAEVRKELMRLSEHRGTFTSNVIENAVLRSLAAKLGAAP